MKILVIDNEVSLCRALKKHLCLAGYETLCATTGAAGLRLATEAQPDIVLLDVRLPDMDGHEICNRLRAEGDVPIIILSALGGEADIIRGLYAGADDYLAKPLRMPELLARIRVQLRATRAAQVVPKGYNDGVLAVDAVLQTVEKQGRRIHLSRTEYRVLSALMESEGEAVSAEDLCRRVWPDAKDVDRRRATLYISYLRRKLEDDPSTPRYLHTVRGRGYVFQPVSGEVG